MKIYILAIVIVVVLSLSIAFYLYAQHIEQMQLTTYYPAPFGNFVELNVNSGVVFIPNANFSVEPGLVCNNTKEAKVAYGKPTGTETNNEFYYCDGSNWQSFPP